jgi:AcrR family transcriptional regulator
VSAALSIGQRGRPITIREEQLLDAARDVFREEGHAATTARIARRAGVSEGILFYRYKSREALLAAVIRRETEPPEALRRVVRTAGERTVRENLSGILRVLLEAIARAFPFLELADASPASAEIRRALMAGSRKPPPERMAELVAGYFADEIRHGRVREIDPLPLARALFGGCIEHVRSRAASWRGAEDVFVSGLVDVVLHGTLAARPPTADRG